MDALLYALGVLVFAFALMLSIALHELGHMIPARKFGGKVTQYFVGFGKTVWSRKRGETEYGLKAVPLGGFVKIVGMLPPGKGDPEKVRVSNTGLFTQLVADARATEWEHIGDEDHDRLFYKFAWWKKVIVMAGGPMVNLFIAFFLFWGLFGFIGYAEPQPEVSEVSQCVLPASEQGRECQPGDPVAPANDAGFKAGDKVVSFNGDQIGSWDELVADIEGNSDGRAEFVVDRNGEEVTLTTNTTVRPTGEEGAEPVGFLGVSPEITIEHGGPIYTAQQMWTMTQQSVEAIATLPVKVYDVGQAIVGLEERDPEGPMSVVGGGRVAGETTSSDEITSEGKIALLLSLIAGFNLFIGLLNFVPLLPLDGGHIAGALYEKLRRVFAQLFRRPDPGYVDVARMLPVAYVMAASLLVMGLVLIVGDIVVPISLPT